jgi:hypothetical protein
LEAVLRLARKTIILYGSTGKEIFLAKNPARKGRTGEMIEKEVKDSNDCTAEWVNKVKVEKGKRSVEDDAEEQDKSEEEEPIVDYDDEENLCPECGNPWCINGKRWWNDGSGEYHLLEKFGDDWYFRKYCMKWTKMFEQHILSLSGNRGTQKLSLSKAFRYFPLLSNSLCLLPFK